MNAPATDLVGVQWTPERVALLRRHHAVGLTAAESAILLGGVTKNAVISKRNRLGLRGLTIIAPGAQQATPATRIRLRRFRPEPMFRCEPLPPMEPSAPPGAAPKPLVQHRKGECLWPLGPVEQPGDWRTLFCCAPVTALKRYCAAHLARSRGASAISAVTIHEG